MITKNPMTSLERRTVSSLALLYCFRMLGLFMVLPLLALYAADLPGATPTLVGLALGIYGLTQAVFQIPLGWLSDHIGRKPVIIGGLLMFVLGSVIAAISTSIEGIILGRTLQGAGAIASTVMALVADLTREEQRTKAMAVVGMSIGLSFAVALVVGPAVAKFGGLSAVFWFTALLALVGIAVLTTLVPTPTAANSGHSEAGPGLGSLRRAIGDSSLLRLNFGVFVLHFILTASFLLVPGLLENSFSIDREQHWLVYLPVLLLSLVGMALLMMLAERGGRLRLAFLLGIGLIFLAVAMLGYASSALLFFAGLWLFFVGFNYLEATLPSLVSKTVFEGGKGGAMGVYATCQFLGAFAGGAAGGWLIQHLGATALITVCMVLAALWWLIVLLTQGPGKAAVSTDPLPGV